MDNYSQWERHEARQEAWLKTRPICCHCGHHIQEDQMFDIEGELYHTSCAMEEFQKWTEDYE